jgi:AcrR family transcriptional regulator
LISKREVLVAALRIIDEEGLAALNIRRLASEFNVNGASFYYHFHNKDEIVAGAAELAMDDVRVPRVSGDDWREWILRNAKVFREALLAHPDLIMVMLRRGRLQIGLRRIDATVSHLEKHGVPAEGTLALLESLETFALGSALSESHRDEEIEIPPELWEKYPKLYLAVKGRALSYEAEFDIVCRSIIDGIAATFGVEPRPWSGSATGKKATRRKSVAASRR